MLTELEKDILKEVGSLCTGNATIALSQLLNQKINLDMPRVMELSLDEIPSLFGELSASIIGIHNRLLGSVEGDIVLLFSEKNAFSLVVLLGEKERGSVGALTEFGISLLKEIGNIVISSYLLALSNFSGLYIFPSIPNLISGEKKTIVDLAFGRGDRTEKAVFIETVFSQPSLEIQGDFYFSLPLNSIQKISEALQAKI